MKKIKVITTRKSATHELDVCPRKKKITKFGSHAYIHGLKSGITGILWPQNEPSVISYPREFVPWLQYILVFGHQTCLVLVLTIIHILSIIFTIGRSSNTTVIDLSWEDRWASWGCIISPLREICTQDSDQTCNWNVLKWVIECSNVI